MEEVDVRRVVSTVRGQLESELFLGARWLPMAKPASGRKKTSGANKQSGGVKVSAARGAVRADKQKRLDEIAGRVRACKGCPLHESRTQGVPGEGDPDARLMFVGEAPGADEDAQGRPFVGRAGQLLTKIIEAMGLRREDVFIANVLKSRPPGNRDPLMTEIEACIGYLYEQIEAIEPEVIVALGAHAARTLLGTTESIGRLRGQVHSWQGEGMSRPVQLVATYHPAYLLRSYSPENRLRVWKDMQMVLKELGLPIPTKK